jgi:pyruvate/2-oxoglutarate dehydrogenase complex dihydrolipoamide acyltransferase (E2) component
VLAILAKPGDARPSGSVFLQIETSDATLVHLKSKSGLVAAPSAHAPAKAAVWTPRATKLAQEAGLDPAGITNIEATGPGGRVSGDDVTRYVEKHRK